jgi:hypothetical protein
MNKEKELTRGNLIKIDDNILNTDFGDLKFRYKNIKKREYELIITRNKNVSLFKVYYSEDFPLSPPKVLYNKVEIGLSDWKKGQGLAENIKAILFWAKIYNEKSFDMEMIFDGDGLELFGLLDKMEEMIAYQKLLT